MSLFRGPDSFRGFHAILPLASRRMPDLEAGSTILGIYLPTRSRFATIEYLLFSIDLRAAFSCFCSDTPERTVFYISL